MIERATADTDRGIRVDRIRRALRQISTGNVRCERCHATATVVSGHADTFRVLCSNCDTSARLDRGIAEQRQRVAAMRHQRP